MCLCISIGLFYVFCELVIQYQFYFGVFRLIEESISSAYCNVRQNHYQSVVSNSGTSIDTTDTTSLLVAGSYIDLPRELFQMLAAAGPYLYRDTILLQKVIRFFSFFFPFTSHYISLIILLTEIVIIYFKIFAGLQSAERLLYVGS